MFNPALVAGREEAKEIDRNLKVPRFSEKKRQEATRIQFFLASARESDRSFPSSLECRWATKPCS
ncbi:hypothetical protein A2U01_0075279 [Trifolium medium]|uniref:Uncharacterized protein n=1 Tax=Trifolium medium TaxID=97028 RepID=A0A392SZT9_9FABA|nr:hypothetical protein [Trifolium medium]